jgi:predicted esterase
MAAVVPAVGKQTATLIFLHGLGDSGHGWADVLAKYRPKYAKLICPHASERPVTLNGGYVMPAWWDIRSLDKLDGNEDEEGIKKCVTQIEEIIQSEIDKGIPASRIVLGGFSQGAATSLYTGLTGKHKLAGLVVLSGYLPIRNTINWSTANKPSVLQCHGLEDHVVRYEIGELASGILTKNLPSFTFKAYEDLSHSSCPEELEDVKAFLKHVLPEIKD